MRFIDTNVLLYAISRDPDEQHKAKRANEILTARDLALSVQVLQEFYVQATRTSRPDALTHQQAVDLVVVHAVSRRRHHNPADARRPCGTSALRLVVLGRRDPGSQPLAGV
ncbi:PIN domain-containing protein [Mycobacterium botniense]|uniref:PIN domain-containing protein n=1 Tax=Mycobacterium botniense TaxID=84962 RepID=UPI001C3FF5A0|nr:PIN domain-containing protein [Mycobacterium botniense]